MAPAALLRVQLTTMLALAFSTPAAAWNLTCGTDTTGPLDGSRIDTLAVPESSPTVAVTFNSAGEAAVSRPEPLICAASVLLTAQLTAAGSTGTPLNASSWPRADICRLLPGSNVRVGGVTTRSESVPVEIVLMTCSELATVRSPPASDGVLTIDTSTSPG